MRIKFTHTFEKISSVENLLAAWQEFVKEKKSKKDVQDFSLNLMTYIFSLNNDLLQHTYKHGGYQAFRVFDPKPREIHKASVRDRLIHHAIHRVLYPFFNRTFISDSFSCRLEKGNHKAINRFRAYFHRISKNNTKTCWVLKCDIQKFFASIDHLILLEILKSYIPDQRVIRLLEQVIVSFTSFTGSKVGLPLGNLTSQLFVNIYMNKFDQFVKHKLKEKYYIRYADDFVVLSPDYKRLTSIVLPIRSYLKQILKLNVHLDKIDIRTVASGSDFLGFVNFSDHLVLRTRTKKRMLNNLQRKSIDLENCLIDQETFNQTLQSYLGLLKHSNSHKLRQEIILRFKRSTNKPHKQRVRR